MCIYVYVDIYLICMCTHYIYIHIMHICVYTPHICVQYTHINIGSIYKYTGVNILLPLLTPKYLLTLPIMVAHIIVICIHLTAAQRL